MEIELFWEYIDRAANSSDKHQALRDSLEKLSDSELVEFQQHFDRLFDSAYRWDLWGAAYVIGGGCSDDGFIDFRYGLISCGSSVFENALENPDSLAGLEVEEIQDEEYGYLVQGVYEERNDEPPPRESTDTGADPVGEEWDFDDEAENRRRLPRLMEKYW